MRCVIAAFLILLPYAACAPPKSDTESAADHAAAELQRLFDDEWEFRLQEQPLFATRVGDGRFNDRLSSASLADFERRLAAEREFLARLQAIDRDALSPAQRISYDVFERLKRDLVEEAGFGGHLMQLTDRTGFLFELAQMPETVPLHTLRDYQNYIARLKAIPELVNQHTALIQRGIETGWVQPRIVVQGILDGALAQAVDRPEDSPLYAPFASFPEDLNAEADTLRASGREVLADQVLPAYRGFCDFLRDTYLPASRESIAASQLPDGNAYYAYLVRHYTTLDDATPESVHQQGLAEVARIRGEMAEVIRQVGFQGSFAEFLAFLRSDPQFYTDSPEQLLKETSWVAKRMDGELPRLFKRLPRLPYGVKPVPDYLAPRTYTAYYDEAAGDGTRAGFYMVNTYDLPSRPLHEIEALSLHESVPGHHLQLALQLELEDLPKFRRFEGFTVFVEGWALYAERLGLEVGFYQNPYSNFGRLSYEMWRACRLVVDTGMHQLGWSRQQAIDYMAENSGLTLHNITTEVDRYIAWPGQALAYKTGELKIRELRARAERELGDRFDLREFHDVVLGNGSVPMAVLEANVNAYIASQQTKS